MQNNSSCLQSSHHNKPHLTNHLTTAMSFMIIAALRGYPTSTAAASAATAVSRIATRHSVATALSSEMILMRSLQPFFPRFPRPPPFLGGVVALQQRQLRIIFFCGGIRAAMILSRCAQTSSSVLWRGKKRSWLSPHHHGAIRRAQSPLIISPLTIIYL